MCVAAPRCQGDADQPDWLPEWEECPGVHEGPVAPAAECPGEHCWHTICFSGTEERGN